MHAADLGVFQDALGSVMWLEASHRAWNPNIEEGVTRLNQFLKSYYVANPGHSEVALTVPMLRADDGYPCLRAKAAQTRHLAPFGLLLACLQAAGNAERPPPPLSAGASSPRQV